MAEIPNVIGRYQVARELAHGGMGSLYLARDPAIDRLVAIKLLREGFEDESVRQRFAREVRATGKLRHPNIVTIFDTGEHGNRPFIAMEYVAGETLASMIHRRALASILEKLTILEEVCDALGCAHEAGIIHRDIKPANVMIEDATGAVKILDFGIAQAGETGLTNAGEMVGTAGLVERLSSIAPL
jgi:serine/threonine-protein kinase